MKDHPHGDASIGDAMVQLGQKNLLIDTQGNWGDPITGDSAAAPRYIEGRLSKFASEVVFNHQTTDWQLSYDGRNQEPVTLPVKFPLVRSEEHTSELQSLMRISYAVFCLKKTTSSDTKATANRNITN